MDDAIEWRLSDAPEPYAPAVAWMEARAAAIAAGTDRECVWLLEHPPLYTGGTSADPSDLRNPAFPVHPSGRGGQYTYHGPGQRIGYVMLDLNRRGRDVRCYVHAVEGWVIAVLARLDIAAYRIDGRVGIWTNVTGGPAKIGAIGVRVRRWVTLHGFSLNRDPDLAHFGGIVPCGISDAGVTSLAALGRDVDAPTLDALIRDEAPRFLAGLTCTG